MEKGVSIHKKLIGTAQENYPYFRDHYWRNAHMLYIQLGYVQAFELQNWKAARATFLAAADLPNAPEYLQQLKAMIQEEGTESVLAIRVLTTLIQVTEDETVKAGYQKKLAEFKAELTVKQAPEGKKH